MRHLKSGKRLGITTSHRKAVMRNLVTSLLEHGQIKTTLTRAKEMRKPFDKMIGLAKRGDLHARRQALSFITSKDTVKKLFDEYGPLYNDRNGGYTRIYHLGTRLGDNASMALIQMVDLIGEDSETSKSAEKSNIQELKKDLQKDSKKASKSKKEASGEKSDKEVKAKKAKTKPEEKKEKEPKEEKANKAVKEEKPRKKKEDSESKS